MISLLVIGIIVVIVGLYLTETNKGRTADPRNRFGGKIAGIIGGIIIIISIVAGSF